VEPTDIRTRLRDLAEDQPVRPPPAAAPAMQVLPPSAFRGGDPADVLRDALGYGLYARAAEDGREKLRAAGDPATADMIERYRAQATADLHAFAFRYLHNHAEQIRQDAVREHLAALRRPPGFLKIAVAAGCGSLAAGAFALWLMPLLAAHGGPGGALAAIIAHLRAFGA
jgi:hypothetical protein